MRAVNDAKIGAYKAQTERQAQQVSAQYTSAQIQKMAADTRQKDRDLDMSADMNEWKKSIDTFNKDLAQQKQNLDNSKLDFEREKFGQSQSNWLKEYDLKIGDYTLAKKKYDLAVQQFKLDKTDKTWKNVLATANTCSSLLKDAVTIRDKNFDYLVKLAELASGKSSKKSKNK